MSPERRPGAHVAPPPPALEDSQRLATVNPCRVLIVDDDDLVRARLAALLKGSNYDIEVAASGTEALRVLGVKHCHIVLTDWEMPDMDGLALCRCVRLSQDDGYVYVLMLTVRSGKEDVLAGLTAGADDYLVKGASIDEILARLEVGRRIVHVERSLRVNRGNRHLSFVDSTTGAHNLRYLAKQLWRELARSQRYGHPLAVLHCEIDKFAEIMQGFGPDAAAAILRAFVARSENCIRTSSDWIARVSAGEFMIVLPETTPYGANRVSQKLDAALRAESVVTSRGALALKANIATIAADPSRRPDSVARIEGLIRSARAGLPPRTGIGDSQHLGDADAELNAKPPGTRVNNRLN